MITGFLRPKKASLSLDMAPLIDVVFQLLIFFMLSSSFLNPALKLTLPKSVEHDPREQQKLTVTVDQEGHVFVNTLKTTMQNLRSALEVQLANQGEKAIHVHGDAEMPYKLFVEVLDLARQAGARQIHIVHEREQA